MGILGTVLAILVAIIISFVGATIVGLAEVARFGGIIAGIILTAYLVIVFITGASGK